MGNLTSSIQQAWPNTLGAFVKLFKIFKKLYSLCIVANDSCGTSFDFWSNGVVLFTRRRRPRLDCDVFVADILFPNYSTDQGLCEVVDVLDKFLAQRMKIVPLFNFLECLVVLGVHFRSKHAGVAHDSEISAP